MDVKKNKYSQETQELIQIENNIAATLQRQTEQYSTETQQLIQISDNITPSLQPQNKQTKNRTSSFSNKSPITHSNPKNSDAIRVSISNYKQQQQQPLRQRLYTKIQQIEPVFYGEITTMLLNKSNPSDLQILLHDKKALNLKISEALSLLKDDYRSSSHQHTTSNNNNNEITPIDSVPNSVISSSSSSSSSSEYSLQSYVSSNGSDDTKVDLQCNPNLISKDDECTSNVLPSSCRLQTIRLIINAPISKPILDALLQKKCIINATFKCIKQIYVRCHKSYYHNDATVIYIHFVNFFDIDYISCGFDDLFNFDRNRNCENILDLMGNRFGLILMIEPIKYYRMIVVPIDHLSKMVRICLRCKLNECQQRKRVCKYCIKEETFDRKKIGEYYHNTIRKSNISIKEIKNDLIQLKIEPHLIPTPIFKTECPQINKCNKNECTFVHNKYQKLFGEKLMKIQRNANKERYLALDYQMINVQMKYRRIIYKYYQRIWKQRTITNNEENMNVIKVDLIKYGIQSLHLMPLVYKVNCDEERCRIRCGKMCAFVHNKKERIFGDILWKIRCCAKQEYIYKKEKSNDDKEIIFNAELFGDNKEKRKHYEWNRSPIEREWGYAIRRYVEAVLDEKEAERKELMKWSIDAANITFKIEKLNKNENTASKRIYGLFIEYEDDKDAEIVPSRTYVTFHFDKAYDVGLRKSNQSKDCPACCFNVCEKGKGHWQFEHDRMILNESNNHKNDKLVGVITEKLKSNRYKVLIKTFKLKKCTWLKFAVIASHKYNKNYPKGFKNVLITYNPSLQYDKIYKILKDLDKKGSMDRTSISSIIFGIQHSMPLSMDDYNVNHDKIKGIFPRLNDSQINAICGSLNYNMHCIQGPPGAGKTSVSAHIAYLWWFYKRNTNNNEKMKIHGLCSTNKGAQVLAVKCMEMNKRINNKNIKPFKVVYFASNTYVDYMYDEYKDNFKLSRICVNIMAERKMKALCNYNNMDKVQKEKWRGEYIKKELESADIICTTFGNSLHEYLKGIDFSHCICDESNQASLETFLGIIDRNLKYLTMAGDVMQLQPVIKSDNELAKKSIYQDIVSYLTNGTMKVNRYYTLLNTQYRSHPQIYGITTELFYKNKVIVNESMMKGCREYKGNTRNYGEMFANKKNHIQFHIYGEKQSDTLSLNQSKSNKFEAEIAMKYIHKFVVELGNNENEIAVISDYKAQKDCVYKLLCDAKGIDEDNVLLCTTNTIEGSSKPFVIYMCCRSNNCGNIGFLEDITRLNVASSRAEFAQIIIADINTLQYNAMYNKLFEYHQKEHAVVCEVKKHHSLKVHNVWNNNNNNNNNNKWLIKSVIPKVPLMKVANEIKFETKRSDYHKCSGCCNIISSKLFCGRMASSSSFCQECMNQYLTRYCKAKKLREQYPEITTMTIINKQDFFATDSAGIISLEFDLILGQYLMRHEMITFCNENELSKKLCNVAMHICSDIKQRTPKKYKYIPKCFKDLVKEYGDKLKKNDGLNKEYYKKLNKKGSPTANALGIMRCKRNHLLQQTMYDTRFFEILNKIKYQNKELKKYYNKCSRNKYDFYKEFKQSQPTLVVCAYLQSCGYSMHHSNRLKKRIGKALVNKNRNEKDSKYSNPKTLNEMELNKFAQELLSDASEGIRNILSMNHMFDVCKFSRYVIELMQNAIIGDCMSSYYQELKHEIAIDKENDFGNKLTKAGFEYISEKKLKENGFKDTPDYTLKKPWIINYNGKRTEITWLDFKWFYCSSSSWCIDKLNAQATRYNKRFGSGAFVFSLGFVQSPKAIQMASYGLLAAVPLTEEYLLRFIEKRI